MPTATVTATATADKTKDEKKPHPPRDAVHTYGGHEFTIHLADPLAEAWYDHDWPRPQEIELLARTIGVGCFSLRELDAEGGVALDRDIRPFQTAEPLGDDASQLVRRERLSAAAAKNGAEQAA